MDEDAKKTIVVFRFGVIADLVGGRKLLRGVIDIQKVKTADLRTMHYGVRF